MSNFEEMDRLLFRIHNYGLNGNSNKLGQLIAKVILFQENDGLCCYCKCHMSLEINRPNTATIDHIVPKKYGGKDEFRNYQLCCGECNNMKGHEISHDHMVFLFTKVREKLFIKTITTNVKSRVSAINRQLGNGKQIALNELNNIFVKVIYELSIPYD